MLGYSYLVGHVYDDSPFSRLIADSLRNRFHAETGVNKITIFVMKAKPVDCENNLRISSEIQIMDSNQQSITGLCLGMALSEVPDFMNCDCCAPWQYEAREFSRVEGHH